MTEMTFEKAMEELEKIVRKLENDQTTLDESIELFDKGVKLSDYCSKKLDDAENKVKILVKNEDGEMEKQDFNGIEE